MEDSSRLGPYICSHLCDFSSPAGFSIINPDVSQYPTVLWLGILQLSRKTQTQVWAWVNVLQKEDNWPHQGLLVAPSSTQIFRGQGLGVLFWIGWAGSSLTVHSAWKSRPQFHHPKQPVITQVHSKAHKISYYHRRNKLPVYQPAWYKVAVLFGHVALAGLHVCSVLSHYPHSMGPRFRPPSEGHFCFGSRTSPGILKGSK